MLGDFDPLKFQRDSWNTRSLNPDGSTRNHENQISNDDRCNMITSAKDNKRCENKAVVFTRYFDTGMRQGVLSKLCKKCYYMPEMEYCKMCGGFGKRTDNGNLLLCCNSRNKLPDCPACCGKGWVIWNKVTNTRTNIEGQKVNNV